jgi:hypothetical protein
MANETGTDTTQTGSTGTDTTTGPTESGGKDPELPVTSG